MGEQRSRLRHRQGVFFSLASFGVGAFLTLPRAKPDDTAVERRSISASRNALAINVILKAAMASPPQIARASCTSSSIASAAVGDLFEQPVTKRLVVLVGQKKAVAIAVRNVSGRRRWSKPSCWLRNTELRPQIDVIQ